MSRMMFHAWKQEPVALSGAETMRLLWNSLSFAFETLYPHRAHLTDLFTGWPVAQDDKEWMFNGFVGGALRGRQFRVGGRSFDLQVVALNTALADDRHRLSARLAGQHEIHCYVEGPNRTWLADLICLGLVNGELQGENATVHAEWSRVAAFLLQNDKYPVVLSGSVTDDPGSVNPRSTFMRKLRERNEDSCLEMKPKTWATIRFGTGDDAFSVLAHLQTPAGRPQ